MVTVSVSMVLGALMAMAIFDKFMSAPLTAIDPSRRTNIVDAKLLSTALAFMRKYPAVPAAMPLKLSVPVLDTVPAEGVPQTRPAVAATPPVMLPLEVAAMVVTVAASAKPLWAVPVPGGATTVTTAPEAVAR